MSTDARDFIEDGEYIEAPNSFSIQENLGTYRQSRHF